MLIGIVGKPSAGKSTFLNAACLTSAKTGDYPFTTIEPNRGTAFVTSPCVCRELGVEDQPRNSLCVDGTRMIQVELLDVAGLVPGAHEGRGMGNKFLSDLARADVLLHVVDLSGSLDAEGNPVDPGSHDPMEDVEFLAEEIARWVAGILTRSDWKKFSANVERQKIPAWRAFLDRLTGLGVRKEHVLDALGQTGLEKKPLGQWDQGDVLSFSRAIQRMAKPIVVVGNKVDQATSEKNLRAMRDAGVDVIPASALAEYWLRTYSEKGVLKYVPGSSGFEVLQPDQMSDQERAVLERVQEQILDVHGSTGVQAALNHAVFDVLRMVTVYPVHDSNKYGDKDGRVLPDAFLVESGTPIKEFVATCIHTELAETFIHAIDARTKKRLGEAYRVKNRDVLKIVSAKGR
ncbi:MAG: redox-regulated ATPase YchF [Promethearchaeota archaeon]